MGRVSDGRAGELPDQQPGNRTLDGAELKALRRAASRLERPEAGITFRVSQDGRAIATGPKGTRVINVPRKFDSDHHESSDYNKLIKELENAISRNTNAGRGRGAGNPAQRASDLARLREQIQGIYKQQESAFKQWEQDARELAAKRGVKLSPARSQVKTTLGPSDQ